MDGVGRIARGAIPAISRDVFNRDGTAELNEVDIAYQMKNVAPVIEQLEITPANYKFPAPLAFTAPRTHPR